MIVHKKKEVMKSPYDQAQALAEAHWEFIKDLLIAHNESSSVIEKCGFHYKSAFIHGYKHCFEEKNQ